MICVLILLVFCANKSYSEIHTAKKALFLEVPIIVMNKIHEYMNKNAADEKQPTSMIMVQLIFAPRIGFAFPKNVMVSRPQIMCPQRRAEEANVNISLLCDMRYSWIPFASTTLSGLECGHCSR